MLDSLADGCMFLLNATAEPFARLLDLHGTQAWVLILLPVLLLDAPRAVIASLTLVIMRAFGLPRGELGRKRLFLASQPSISVVVAAYNEAESLSRTILTLLEFRRSLPSLQIIVVDDHSTDGTYESVKAFAARGEIILLRNSAASGRGGKPAAINIGLRFATGDFLVPIDADCTFDHNLLLHLIGPFYDPRVGAVASNVKVRNPHRSILTAMQAIEYLVVIGLNKRWLNVTGANYIASGACGAYRREALEPYLGCDVETAEDLDNSLKVRRGGWKLRFAPEAICMTDVPEQLGQLVRQRQRWDRDLVRVAMRKHRQALDPRHVGWPVALELWYQLTVAVFFNYLFFAYVLYVLWTDPWLLPVIILITWLVGMILVCVPFLVAVLSGERRREELVYLIGLPLYPLYSECILRWVRTWANTLELLRVGQEDPYLPQSAWRNSPRW